MTRAATRANRLSVPLPTKPGCGAVWPPGVRSGAALSHTAADARLSKQAEFWIPPMHGSLRRVSEKSPLHELMEATLAEALVAPAEAGALTKRLKTVPRPNRELMLDASRFAFDLAARAITAAQRASSAAEADLAWRWLRAMTDALVGLAHDAPVAPLSKAYFSPGVACRDAVRDAIDGATRCLDVCVFTITDDYISKALMAAHRRGVAVRIITDNDKGQDPGSDIERLRRGGIPIRCDRTEYHMHHKFVIVDRRTLLNGSYNWTRGAFSYNQENVVVCRDQHLIAEFQRTFDDLWRDFEA